MDHSNEPFYDIYYDRQNRPINTEKVPRLQKSPVTPADGTE